jgi:tetratricopeptide (TPR) repeat protein
VRGLGAISIGMLLVGCAATGGGQRSTVAAAPPAAPSGDVLAMVAQAQLRLEAGEIAEGLQLFGKAVAAAPDDGEVREEYGLSLAAVGLGDNAVEQLTKVGKLSPAGEATLGILLAQKASDRASLEAAVPHMEAGLTAIPQGLTCRLTLAQTLLRLGRGADAWPHAQALLAERPDDPRLLLLAGQALRMAGRGTEAADYLKRAAENPEARPRAMVELVEALAADGKYREAADVMGELIRTEGTTTAALTRWATLLLRAGDKDKANEVLDNILAKDPTVRDALLLKAALAAGSGDPQTAEQLYRRALANDPKDPDAALGLARLLVDVRRIPEARTLLDGVWARVVENKLEAEDVGLEIAQEQAALELIDEKPDAVLPWLQRLEKDALSRRSLALWAGYFRLRKANREGVDFFTAAKTSDEPGADRARAAFEAEFRLAVGDEDAGHKLLEPLLAGSEDEVLAALGTLERGKRYAEVVTLARAALARLGDARGVQFALAASLERSGAWDEAVKEFRALLARSPDDAGSLNYLGYMFADRGVHLDEALTMLLKAVSLDPTSGAFIDSLGWVYFRLGRLELAEKNLTEAARLTPNDVTVNEHLGDLYLAINERDKAAAAFRKALAGESEEEGQPERIRGKLQSLGVDVPR